MTDIPVFIRPVKPYTKEEDQFLRGSFPTQTHKEMGKALGRSIESIRGRCRYLQLIRPVVTNRMIVASVRTGQKQPEGLDLAELPANLQKWFGLASNEIPLAAMPYIRRIEEKMPDIPIRSAKHHIGCGTQHMIGELANL